MKNLRKISSKFGLRRKDQQSTSRIIEPIFEESADSREQDWRSYVPTGYEGYETLEDDTGNDSDYEERIQLPPQWAPKTLPSARRNGFGKPSLPPELPELWENLDPPVLKQSRSNKGNMQQLMYGGEELPLFGPQYGIHRGSRVEDIQVQTPTVMHVKTSNPYIDMLEEADADLQRAYLESLETATAGGGEDGSKFQGMLFSPPPVSAPLISSNVMSEEVDIPEPSVRSASSPTSCIICTEDFEGAVRPPGWISLACLHEPSVCTGCLAKCIKSDLESKIWNQIKCPECKALLIYEDIKRFADPESLARYEIMSVRSAVSSDNNFVWCQKCDFGQLHASGASQPIVRCLNCGFASCYTHNTPWHTRLTCEEYDQMLEDPDGFQTERDKENEANDVARRQQEEEDERLARELNQRDKMVEEDRQRQRLAEERRRAKEQQRAEAARKKQELEQAKRREEIKRRQREEKASRDVVQATTKPCPGCQWAIEKNDGCDHMTCMSFAGAAYRTGEPMEGDIAAEGFKKKHNPSCKPVAVLYDTMYELTLLIRTFMYLNENCVQF
ncbi:hypothetical protein G7Y89_g12120 [Cudoniella acicularis]|uniref:RBR-type E3 ubiquitin transferase n=1 Tax=Cudoniella acicularis TaxID=354080 RepID=A0A8H4R9H8_9HELO|nr:hypothetical protein G7Y89_g12120 [Cudoniella acicularis]